MLAYDFIMIGGLIAFAFALTVLRRGGRTAMLVIAAAVALAAGVASLGSGMWQAVPGAAASALMLTGAVIAVFAAGKKVKTGTEGSSSVIAFVLPVLAWLGVAAAAPYYFVPIPVLPAPGGPHEVGTLVFDLKDESRRGVLEDGPDEVRRIYVQAWYPAQDTDGLKRRPYFTRWQAENLAPAFAGNWGFPSFSFSHLRHIGAHAFENAPIASQDGGLPVVIYSHGYWGWEGQNTALMEELASRGYIVFSIAHPYDSGGVKFSDGSIIGSGPPSDSYEFGPGMLAFLSATDHDARWAAFPAYRDEFDRHRLMRSFEAWTADTRFLLASLRAGDVPEPARSLADASDPSRLAFAGMSFGGTVAASVCEIEPSCKAAANLDGEEFDWSLYDHDIRMPLLMLHSDWVRYAWSELPPPDPGFNYNDFAYERFETAGTSENVYRFRVRDLRHAGLSDLILGARQPIRGKYLGDIDGKEAIAIMNDFTANFLDRFVLKQQNDFPNAQLAAHPLVLPHSASGVREWRKGKDVDEDAADAAP